MTSNTRLVIALSAHKDWREILDYTRRKWGIAQQETYDDIIWNAFQRIKTFPEIGRRVPESEPELRELILEHHTIIYNYRPHTVTILRIVNPQRHRR